MSNKHDDWFKNKKINKKEDSKQVQSDVSKTSNKTPSKNKVFSLFSNNNKKTVKPTQAKQVNPNSKLFKVKQSIKKSTDKVKAKPLLIKIMFTLLMILIFRVAASITMPGIELTDKFKHGAADTSSFLGIMDMMGGGALKNFSVVALGISPYITASIIVQLLTSEAFPPLNRLSKSGPAGKRKINMISRVITLVFAVIQAITMIQQLGSGNLVLYSSMDTPLFKYFAIPTILVAGSMFTLFLGEQITNKGVGNGTSLIIFSGIAVNLPYQFKNAYYELVEGNAGQSTFVGSLNLVFYCSVFLLLIYIIGVMYLAERRVPIQQTGSGLVTDKSQMSHLPIKLNPAGVMPVIFSMALSVLPVTIAQFFHHQNEGRLWIEENLRLTSPIGLSIFIVLTFLFTIVMSLVTFNPYNVADGFKKNGTFIPGVRPGQETEKYLTGIVLRLSFFSAIYLSAISAIQYIQQIIGLSQQISFGGTTLIILVTVSIETISQLKARDKTQKIAKARQNTMASSTGANGGLLW